MKEAHTLIREASLADISKLQTVLIQAQLSDDDILADGTRYWLAENVDGQPVGIVGLELGETAVLLRSAAVSLSLRGQGLATSLVQRALDAAAGYRHVYLFSTGAGAYWQRLGWCLVPVSETRCSSAPCTAGRAIWNFGLVANRGGMAIRSGWLKTDRTVQDYTACSTFIRSKVKMGTTEHLTLQKFMERQHAGPFPRRSTDHCGCWVRGC